MTTRHHPFPDIFDAQLWPITDTRSCKQTWKFSAPGWRDDRDYQSDCAEFAKFNLERRSFIRLSSLQAEPLPTGSWDWTCVPPLQIWVVIIRIAPGWHVEFPFYRGPQPFSVEPSTDAEVAAVVSECVAVGGYGERQLEKWRAAVAAKR
jgi:hypothetical protein